MTLHCAREGARLQMGAPSAAPARRAACEPAEDDATRPRFRRSANPPLGKWSEADAVDDLVSVEVDPVELVRSRCLPDSQVRERELAALHGDPGGDPVAGWIEAHELLGRGGDPDRACSGERHAALESCDRPLGKDAARARLDLP